MGQVNKETYWSQFAEDFESKQSFVIGEELTSLVKEELLNEKGLGNVLELGCGTGLYTETLQKNAKHITATDFSDEMIHSAQKLRGDLEHVDFVKADATNLNFPKESFDAVFMANLIHVIGDPEKVIQESKRVLNENGVILITSFAIDQMKLMNKIRMIIRFIKTFDKPPKETGKVKTSKKAIERMLTNNGFEIIKSKVFGIKAKSIYIVVRKLTMNN